MHMLQFIYSSTFAPYVKPSNKVHLIYSIKCPIAERFTEGYSHVTKIFQLHLIKRTLVEILKHKLVVNVDLRTSHFYPF